MNLCITEQHFKFNFRSLNLTLILKNIIILSLNTLTHVILLCSNDPQAQVQDIHRNTMHDHHYQAITCIHALGTKICCAQ